MYNLTAFNNIYSLVSFIVFSVIPSFMLFFVILMAFFCSAVCSFLFSNIPFPVHIFLMFYFLQTVNLDLAKSQIHTTLSRMSSRVSIDLIDDTDVLPFSTVAENRRIADASLLTLGSQCNLLDDTDTAPLSMVDDGEDSDCENCETENASNHLPV